MRRFWNTLLAVTLCSVAACGTEDPFDSPDLPSDVGVAGDGRLAEVLEPIRAAWEVPSLAAFMIHEGQMVEISAVGVRSTASSEQVTTQDLWHVGSLGKAMTATLAAVLVEDGVMSWTTTVAEALPDVAPLVREEFRDVRLEELLSHTSGVMAAIDDTEWWRTRPHTEDIHTQRVAWAQEIMQNQAGAPRGSFLYSNGGYVIAGAMIEEMTGETWEDLITDRVFHRLGMFTAEFGAPGRPGSLLQPWGHKLELGQYVPVEPGPDADNPPALGPAGTVHLSMSDYAKFAADHIAGERGVDGLVSAETYERLHEQAPGTASGLGWLLGVRVWASGIALHHEGSNLLWYANVWLAPERDVGLFAVTNAGEERAFQATDAAISALIERFDAAQAP